MLFKVCIQIKVYNIIWETNPEKWVNCKQCGWSRLGILPNYSGYLFIYSIFFLIESGETGIMKRLNYLYTYDEKVIEKHALKYLKCVNASKEERLFRMSWGVLVE